MLYYENLSTNGFDFNGYRQIAYRMNVAGTVDFLHIFLIIFNSFLKNTNFNNLWLNQLFKIKDIFKVHIIPN